MISRDFYSVLKRYQASFSAVLVVGARQVGKTTLVKHALLKTHQYALLEDPDTRTLALNDPRTFLQKYSPPVIIDEFQYAPELVSYLQGVIDENREQKGLIILTGSQNFQMMNQVKQSLAGRVGILVLYGLSSLEIQKDHLFEHHSIAKLILRGSYPELWQDTIINPRDWISSYIQTFLERDLRNFADIGDLLSFEKFLKILALRTAQVLNISEVAKDCGVSSPTAKKWLSILERAFVIRLVPPYLNNLTSRVRKANKIYFLDTGIVSYLMGFRDAESLNQSPHAGALFENLVYADFIKRNANLGDIPDHFYLQTKTKVGVDFIIQKNQQLELFEIKYTQTFHNKHVEQLLLTKNALKNVKSLTLIMPVQEDYQTLVDGEEISVKNWSRM